MRIRKQYKPEVACAKPGQDRPNLENPFLDHEQKLLVATDGFVLVMVPIEIDRGDQKYVSKAALEYARKRAERYVDHITLDTNPNPTDGFVARPKFASKVQPTGETFPIEEWGDPPNYKSALGVTKAKPADGQPVRTVGLNVNLLVKAAKALGTSRISITVGGPLEGIVVKSADYQDKEDQRAMAIVMPLRIWNA